MYLRFNRYLLIVFKANLFQFYKQTNTMSQFIPSDSVWKLRLDSKGDCPFAFIDLLSRSCYFVVFVLVLYVSQWIHVCFCVLTPSRFSCKYLLVSSFVKCIVCLLSPVCYFHLWLVPFFVSHCPVLVWSSILLACRDGYRCPRFWHKR